MTPLDIYLAVGLILIGLFLFLSLIWLLANTIKAMLEPKPMWISDRCFKYWAEERKYKKELYKPKSNSYITGKGGLKWTK